MFNFCNLQKQFLEINKQINKYSNEFLHARYFDTDYDSYRFSDEQDKKVQMFKNGIFSSSNWDEKYPRFSNRLTCWKDKQSRSCQAEL